MPDPHDYLAQMLKDGAAWLTDGAPEGEVVVSTRIRLARNLLGYRFPERADDEHRYEILDRVTGTVINALPGDPIEFIMEALSDNDRQFLMERHLVSRELCESETGAAVFVADGERCSIMVNEEDHLRIQVLRPGLQISDAWQEADRIDSRLMDELPFAFSSDLGFLTACPSNLGTGMRASVMLHLPAIVLNGHIRGLVKAVEKLGYTVRGLFGEGTESMGNLYQISNQSTLGESESRILSRIGKLIRQIVTHEKNARQQLIDKNPKRVYDHIGRAYGVLRYAYVLDSMEALTQLSAVRLGIDLGMFRTLNARIINELMLMSQPAHLQRLVQEDLEPEKRDTARARLLRQRLAKPKTETPKTDSDESDTPGSEDGLPSG